VAGGSSPPSPYLDALKMIARRELSEAQVRLRLARRHHDPDAIDAAVARLKAERAIDDVRVAEAMARTETAVKRHGRLRVKRQLESAGIAPETARQAIDGAFASVDDEQAIEAALARRLHGRERAADDREVQRLYRYLVGQGFEPDKIAKALRAKRPARGSDVEPEF
jgi:regulatory protein